MYDLKRVLFFQLVELSYIYSRLPCAKGHWRMIRWLRCQQPESLGSGRRIRRLGQYWLVEDLENQVEEALFYGKTYDAQTLAMALRCVDKGSHIIDIGANIGFFSVILSRIVGESGCVVAFEPSPRFHPRLLANVKVNGLRNVIPIQLALADEAGHTRLISTHSSASVVSDFGMTPTRKDRVSTETLDRILSTLELPKLDLIKLDVDGYDHKVLRGAKETIHRFKPDIIAELSDLTLEAAGTSSREMLRYLRFHDYLFSIDGIDYTHDVDQIIDCLRRDGRRYIDIMCRWDGKV